MKSSLQIRNELAENKAKAEALADLVQSENRDGFNEEEAKQIEALKSEQEVLNKSLDTAIKYEALVANRLKPEIDRKRQLPTNGDPRLTVPIRMKSSFRPGVFNTAEDAYKCGRWVAAAIYGHKKSAQFCNESGYKLRSVRNAMGTGDNTKGGFLVPEPLQASIIERREQYGTFAQYSMPWQMGGPVDQVPRLTGEATSGWGSENTAMTAADMAFGMVRLEARKNYSMILLSEEVNEDSLISLAELFVRSCASRFAYDEDNAGFNGDGTSTYGGIVGAANKLLAGSVATTATGITTVATLTMAVFENAIGKCKLYAGIQPRWYFSQYVWSNGPQRLLDAIGGNTNVTLANGSPGMMFKGYPVSIVQPLYSGTGAVSTIFGYFGDLSLTSYLGRRRGMTIKQSSDRYFEYDQIAIKATQRLDINVYDTGTASDSGGLIALKFAAS